MTRFAEFTWTFDPEPCQIRFVAMQTADGGFSIQATVQLTEAAYRNCSLEDWDEFAPVTTEPFQRVSECVRSAFDIASARFGAPRADDYDESNYASEIHWQLNESLKASRFVTEDAQRALKNVAWSIMDRQDNTRRFLVANTDRDTRLACLEQTLLLVVEAGGLSLDELGESWEHGQQAKAEIAAETNRPQWMVV